MSTVICLNTPPLREMHNLVEQFRKQSMSNKDKVEVLEKSNFCKFIFENAEIGLVFLKFVNEIKEKNKIYYKIKASYKPFKDFENKSVSTKRVKAKKENTENTLITESKLTKLKNEMLNKHKRLTNIITKYESMKKTTNHTNSKSKPTSPSPKRNGNHFQHSSHVKSILLQKRGSGVILDDFELRKNIISQYLKKTSPLNIAAPYIDDKDIKKINEKGNRNLWVVDKDFITSAINHHKEKDFIPNYVTCEKSEDVNKHVFRSINKDKWIDKKDFRIKKAVIEPLF